MQVVDKRLLTGGNSRQAHACAFEPDEGCEPSSSDPRCRIPRVRKGLFYCDNVVGTQQVMSLLLHIYILQKNKPPNENTDKPPGPRATGADATICQAISERLLPKDRWC